MFYIYVTTYNTTRNVCYNTVTVKKCCQVAEEKKIYIKFVNKGFPSVL